uniref:G-protein alpha subunit n=1 Tax=Ditylenchus dipsaci TaxID=166011 RepID=A0A915DCE3_9BILA
MSNTRGAPTFMPYLGGAYPLPHPSLLDEDALNRAAIKQIVDWGSLNLSSCLQILFGSCIFALGVARMFLRADYAKGQELFYGISVVCAGLIGYFAVRHRSYCMAVSCFVLSIINAVLVFVPFLSGILPLIPLLTAASSGKPSISINGTNEPIEVDLALSILSLLQFAASLIVGVYGCRAVGSTIGHVEQLRFQQQTGNPLIDRNFLASNHEVEDLAKKFGSELDIGAIYSQGKPILWIKNAKKVIESRLLHLHQSKQLQLDGKYGEKIFLFLVGDKGGSSTKIIIGIANSRAIDKKIRETQSTEDKVIKLLLLGAGECGKSTLMKQMRILHSDGFTEEELLQQRSVVYSNTVHAMDELLRGMAMYKIGFKEPKRAEDARVVMETIKSGEESEPFSDELAVALKRLRLEFHLHDSAKHFLDNLDRICNPSYRPSQQDILLTRIKTTGIVEVNFIIKGVHFRVFDVGGQRSERKKWIHCFEDVNAIIFVAAVSEYDEVLFEDETTNRMIESMRLFESICNSRWFINTSIILFLNKKDLFAEKIKFVSIRTCFKEYAGPQTYDDSINYIRKKFDALNANPRKTIYVHQTCATDTDQVQLILDSVISMIIQSNLHKSGLY